MIMTDICPCHTPREGGTCSVRGGAPGARPGGPQGHAAFLTSTCSALPGAPFRASSFLPLLRSLSFSRLRRTGSLSLAVSVSLRTSVLDLYLLGFAARRLGDPDPQHAT